jgi:adenosyl cobinamide kinase/adenosyl cobinamide phosphate guanylyltransferase
MSRSTLSERAQRLNAAFHLLADGRSLNEAAEAMAEEHRISRRQAYRYLLKVPAAVAVTLRAYAQAHDLTMGETLTRAVCALLATAGGRG